MALVVSGGKAAMMPLHANSLPLSINTKSRVLSASAFPLFSSTPHLPSRSLSIRLSPNVSRSLTVVSSVLSEDRATNVSGSGTDAFKLTYLEVNLYYLSICISKCCILFDYYYVFHFCGS